MRCSSVGSDHGHAGCDRSAGFGVPLRVRVEHFFARGNCDRPSVLRQQEVVVLGQVRHHSPHVLSAFWFSAPLWADGEAGMIPLFAHSLARRNGGCPID